MHRRLIVGISFFFQHSQGSVLFFDPRLIALAVLSFPDAESAFISAHLLTAQSLQQICTAAALTVFLFAPVAFLSADIFRDTVIGIRRSPGNLSAVPVENSGPLRRFRQFRQVLSLCHDSQRFVSVELQKTDPHREKRQSCGKKRHRQIQSLFHTIYILHIKYFLHKRSSLCHNIY